MLDVLEERSDRVLSRRFIQPPPRKSIIDYLFNSAEQISQLDISLMNIPPAVAVD